MVFKEKFNHWKTEILSRKYLLAFSIGIFVIALVGNYLSGVYVMENGSAVTSDLILSQFSPINLGIIYSYFFLIVAALMIIYPLFFKPRELSYTLFIYALLIITRSIFIMLTHLKIPIDAIPVHTPGLFPPGIDLMVFDNDLFFSGHTAVPFLGFFLFKDSWIKWFFLASSIIAAATVMIMHRHYSIDVAGAFFIAYGTYILGRRMLKKARPESL